jgi:hypothetical protein
MTITVRESGAAADILAVMHACHAAMVARRTDLLADLLGADYALVHITGHVQPKDEWFDVIRSGAFDYHRIEIDERTLSVEVAGNAATVRGRGIFDATIDGMHAPWRLQFTLDFARDGAGWKIGHAAYIRAVVEASLRRLRTDRIDLL